MAIRRLGGSTDPSAGAGSEGAAEQGAGRAPGPGGGAEEVSRGVGDACSGSEALPAEKEAEVLELERMLAAYEWWTAPAEGAVAWSAILEQVGRCEAAGFSGQARSAWHRLAPSSAEYPAPNKVAVSVAANEVADSEWIPRGGAESSDVSSAAGERAWPAPARRSAPWPGSGTASAPFTEPHRRALFDQHRREHEEVAGAKAQADARKGPTDLLSLLLSVPGAIAVASWQAAKGLWNGRHVDGMALSESQMDATAERIKRLTEALREEGMAGLAERMRATGRSAEEVFAGINGGGPFESFGGEFRSLLNQPRFAQLNVALENELANFRFIAERHARMGVETGKPYSEAIERNVEAIVGATEGLMLKKGEMLLHAQDVARKMSGWIESLLRGLVSPGARA